MSDNQHVVLTAARNILNLFTPLIGLTVLSFIVIMLVSVIVALFKRQLRRSLSRACATIAPPLLFVAQGHLATCDPYFWYVLANETQLEAQAAKVSTEQSPIFAIVESRDVSVGLAINPPTFTSIVYDASDVICTLDQEHLARFWQHRDPSSGISSRPWPMPNEISARHLLGHFYLVETTIQ